MLDWDALEPERHRPLRRSEYDRLVEAGVFANERVELLHGWLVTMSPQSNEHAWVVAEIAQLLTTQLLQLGWLDRLTVRSHSPYAASDYSEPEPDVSVVPRQEFGEALPDRAHLMIEVSVSSLRKDRTIKTGIYADAGVPEYWIVDISGGAVEVYTEARDGAYQHVARLAREDVLRPRELPGVAIAVRDILPRVE